MLEEGDDLENWTFRMLASSVLLERNVNVWWLDRWQTKSWPIFQALRGDKGIAAVRFVVFHAKMLRKRGWLTENQQGDHWVGEGTKNNSGIDDAEIGARHVMKEQKRRCKTRSLSRKANETEGWTTLKLILKHELSYPGRLCSFLCLATDEYFSPHSTAFHRNFPWRFLDRENSHRSIIADRLTSP